MIHQISPRSLQPFIEVHCATLPDTLLEAELFGYEKGAFTDARSAKRGLFEAADGGTIFLDEIDHIGLEAQAKLLHFIETRTFRRLDRWRYGGLMPALLRLPMWPSRPPSPAAPLPTSTIG